MYDKRQLRQILTDLHVERRGYRPGRRASDELQHIDSEQKKGTTIALPNALGEALDAATMATLHDALAGHLTRADMVRLRNLIDAQQAEPTGA